MSIIDLVKWDSSNPRLVAWKYPSTDLSTWTQLIVNDTQEAWLVHEGNYEGPFLGGRHVLKTENIPILAEVMKLPFGGDTPFSAEVWFINKTDQLDLKWGTLEPMQVMDPIYGVLLPVRAFSQYGLRIVDGRRFLGKLVGTGKLMTSDTLNDYFRGVFSSVVKSYISDLIISQRAPIFELSRHLQTMSNELPAKLNGTLMEYGIEVVRFNVMSVSVDESDSTVKELKAMLAQKAQLNVLGANYGQVRSFDVLEGVAQNQGSAGAFMGMGVAGGFGTGMAGHVGGVLNTQTPQSLDQALPMTEKIRLLKELAQLKDEGVITEEEFQAQKKGLLG